MRNPLRNITRSWPRAMSNGYEPGVPPSTVRRMLGAHDATDEFADHSWDERADSFDYGWGEPYGCGCPACALACGTDVPPFRVSALVNG